MNCPLCLTINQDTFFVGPNGGYFHCHNCDLIYLDSSCYLSEQDEKKRYDSHQNLPSDEKYKNYLLSTFKHFEGQLPKQAKLIDFGCGPTEGMKFVLKDLGYECDSYDPFYFPHMNLLNKKFDGVILSESLEHFYHPQKEFERISGLLNCPGQILVRTERHLGEKHFSSWYYHKDPTHVIFFSINTFEFVANHYNLLVSFPDKNITLLRRSIEA